MVEELKNTNLNLKLENGKQIYVKYGTTINELMSKLNIINDNVIAAKVNNSIRRLDYNLCEDATISFLDKSSVDGYRVYVRTAKFLLNMAISELYPDTQIDICNSISDAFYFIVKNATVTEDMLINIKEKMQEIIANNCYITRRSILFEEARYLFETKKITRGIENFNLKLNQSITVYNCNDFYLIPDGIVAENFKTIKEFELKKFRQGFLLLLPKEEGKTLNLNTNIYSVFEKDNTFLDRINIRNIAELNKSIISGDIDDVILKNEKEHEENMLNLVKDIEQRKNIKIILIAGPSSSGKTTFAKKLCKELEKISYTPKVISMDNYFKERIDTPKQENGEYDFETIEAMDLELFNRDFVSLLAGKKVELPEFNFITGCKEYKGNYLSLNEKDVLILEGIHALNPRILEKVEDNIKYKIYIAPMTSLNIDEYSKVSTTDTRILRRILRDYITRGHEVEKTLSMWANLIKGENTWIYPYIERADYIYNTSYAYEIAVIKPLVEPLLLKIDNNSMYFSEARRLYVFLQRFLPIESIKVPKTSIMREFIGNLELD